MISRFRAGDLDGARALDEELRPAIDLLRVQTNPIAIKTASTCSATRSAASGCRSSMRLPRRKTPCATASSGSGAPAARSSLELELELELEPLDLLDGLEAEHAVGVDDVGRVSPRVERAWPLAEDSAGAE